MRGAPGPRGREAQRQRHFKRLERLHNVIDPVDRAWSVPIGPADAGAHPPDTEVVEQCQHTPEPLALLPVDPFAHAGAARRPFRQSRRGWLVSAARVVDAHTEVAVIRAALGATVPCYRLPAL